MSDIDAIGRQISDLRKSLLVTSGAGCGKTYRMVQRYTAIIEAGVDVTRIIAVTFTEKAAAELKDRVRARCREMMARTEGAERERWVRAARRLALAPVSTIHGLCGRLLREHALTAGIDPQFAQLDETQHDLLLRETVRTFHEQGPTEAELVAAKKNITGGFPLRIDSNSKIVEYLAMIGFYDLPLDYLETFNERVMAVTREQIRDAFQRRVPLQHMATVIVGGEPDS